jgi:hypothetical protein
MSHFNPLNPFDNGVPGDPMEEVLSLQAYGASYLASSDPISTSTCTISCVATCTVSCTSTCPASHEPSLE